ncbi:substrate-binding domain-containing protein [uncultured Rubinisphaera sp.]|uniref:substrate-binding domain-containing protein n=1 Tax=uncultured Rubinisphaera sp. TaxID=1678686 RepID=UPI0030DB3896
MIPRFARFSFRPYVAVIALTLAMLSSCTKPESSGGGNTVGKDEKVTLAFITNVVASFWEVAEKGAEAAGKEFNADVKIFMPTDYAAEQKRIVEDLLIRGIDGIAITVIDQEGQMDMLNNAAEQTHLITHDSDAPETDRLCYIGIDNYDAGLACGELVKQAIPDGGEIMLYVGNLDQINARLRRQGVIDAVLGREPDSSRYDNPGEVVKNDKYTILDTRTDGADFAKAKADASDTISKHPNLACMVGLFAYNPPLCLQAVKDAGKLDQIKIVGFDEEGGTLQGIIDGEIFGTVVQNPYMYGYDSIRILAGLARGEDLKTLMKATEGVHVEEEDTILFPARIIKKTPNPEAKNEFEVEAFWARLKELTE